MCYGLSGRVVFPFSAFPPKDEKRLEKTQNKTFLLFVDPSTLSKVSSLEVKKDLLQHKYKLKNKNRKCARWERCITEREVYLICGSGILGERIGVKFSESCRVTNLGGLEGARIINPLNMRHFSLISGPGFGQLCDPEERKKKRERK